MKKEKVKGEKVGAKFKNFGLSIQKFWSGNTMSASLDNVVAMFPSTILMPLLINTSVGFELFDISLVLFMSGVCTFLFVLYTRGRMPIYLGSSFAFIGTTVYMVKSLLADGVAQSEMLGYVIGAYLSAGLFFLLLSLIVWLCSRNIKDETAVNEKTMKIIHIIIPPAVMGSAISLIGLELAGQSAQQAGLSGGFNSDSLLALTTIVLIILLSVTHRKLFKKSSIFLGVLIVGLIAIIVGKWDMAPVLSAPIIVAPRFRFVLPRFTLSTVLIVLPPTIIMFCEHIGRKIMVDGLKSSQKNNYLELGFDKPKPATLFRTMSGHALAVALSGLMGGVPLTMYAENVGVMRINNDSRPNQFYVAAVLVILFSFSGNLLQLIETLPSAILGGLSLVLMGTIATPGIQMLVDDKVDYNKITNLFLTAAVLISGLSEMSVVIAGTQITGMSLGLLVGILLNLVFMLLKRLSISKEHFSFEEACAFCDEVGAAGSYRKKLSDNDTEAEFFVNDEFYAKVSNDYDCVRVTVLTDVHDDDCLIRFRTKKVDDKIHLDIDGSINDRKIKELIRTSYAIAVGRTTPTASPTDGAEAETETPEAEQAAKTADTKTEQAEIKTEQATDTKQAAPDSAPKPKVQLEEAAKVEPSDPVGKEKR